MMQDFEYPVSKTALWVCAIRAAETEKKDALIQDPLAKVLSGEEGEKVLKHFRENISIKVNQTGFNLDPEFVRKHASHTFTVADANIPLRTKFLDDAIVNNLNLMHAAASRQQLVILAAGLDARAFRLPFPENTTVFELDQPEVLHYKEAKLNQVDGLKLTCEQRHTIAIDLQDKWADALIAAGYDPSLPTVWVTEGLLMYLTKDGVISLLNTIQEIAQYSSGVLHCLVGDILHQNFLKLYELQFLSAMKKFGAPFQFGIDEDPETFFLPFGWTRVEGFQVTDKEVNVDHRFPFLPPDLPVNIFFRAHMIS